ncbi:hypothetical protein BDK51DRAFT_32468 [Blyttiomyces helicus]|uniref:Beta-Casp domain-containing protein n=1 Tax=Blyttiomyces helicus TaxID=388810 RepID=A0A4P9W127_9FUNG|nr:hypothetical protein BDK51DRAFT_32468 [Blyttiomyces helicus]|eukprot:RKO85869.1 hypothetical protein BDK51DRAFT_32468 [Blyttiomyces helicus]
MPLPHGQMLQSFSLYHHDDLQSLFRHDGPFIVFAGHPSLRGGDVAQLIELWMEDPRNLLVLTEPRDLFPGDPTAPFTSSPSFRMEVARVPLDTRLTEQDLASVCKKAQPERVVLIASRQPSCTSAPKPRVDLGTTDVTVLEPLRMFEMDSAARFEKVVMTHEDSLTFTAPAPPPLRHLQSALKLNLNSSDPSNLQFASVRGVLSKTPTRSLLETVEFGTSPLGPPLSGSVKSVLARCVRELPHARVFATSDGHTLEWNLGRDRVLFTDTTITIDASCPDRLHEARAVVLARPGAEEDEEQEGMAPVEDEDMGVGEEEEDEFSR